MSKEQRKFKFSLVKRDEHHKVEPEDLSKYLSIFLISIYLSIYLYIYLSIHLSRYEYGEMNITKLNHRIDDIEDEIYREKLKIKKVSDELSDTFDDMLTTTEQI